MAVVDNGGWLADKESAVADVESTTTTTRFERWRGQRQLLLFLILIAAFVIVIAMIFGAFIYIYYAPHQVKPKIPPKTCEKMYCTNGAHCQVDHATQQAYCRCQESCAELFAPVCGSDGVTYSSECQLKMAACTQQIRLKVHYQGHCGSKDPCDEKECPFGARCRPNLDQRTAECICPDRCATYGDSRGSKPVCGTDGKDYSNDCELSKTSCKEMREIHVKFQGKCDPCDGVVCPTSQVCQLDENRNPICRCNANCSPDVKTVCGSDGKTYANECALRVESCRSRKNLRIIYTGECSTGANPCEGLSCNAKEVCDIDRYGIASCQCPTVCEAVMKPVCGSDGRTYPSECELNRSGCASGREVTVSYLGECGERGPCHKHQCGFGSACVIKGGYAVCECISCTEEFEPVCGTDGISYTNLCKLKRESCEQKTHVRIAYEGLCSGCKNKRCDFYAVCESNERNDARCVCPHSCVKVESSVCGTDGVTYTNECEMRVAACKKQQYVVVGTRGPCDLCQNVHCKYNARCENGQCVCPTECPSELYEPVCATDGATHYNECEMRRSACLQTKDVNVLFYGECDDVNSSGQGGSPVSVGCDAKLCNHGAACDLNEDDLPVCICNFDCPLIMEPVCGSDGTVHTNDCSLKEASCRKQQQIYILPLSMCDDDKVLPCEGEQSLKDPLTGEDYFCGKGAGAKRCPPSSYCHKTSTFAKCCREVALIKTCADTSYGCCPDDRTSALGPRFAGCPSVCNCNRLGSYGATCDAGNKQCSCKPGVGGLRCDRCEPGYWGLHKATEGHAGCTTCNCNLLGSVRDDCEQMTGRCVCRQGIKGMKCDSCPHGAVLGSNGCTDASISQAIAGSCTDMVCLHGATCKEKEEDGLKAQCFCDFQCSSANANFINQSVCGSDGNTYGSECQMRLFGCRYQRSIFVGNEGPCKRRSGFVDDDWSTPSPARRSTVRQNSDGLTDVKSTRDVRLTEQETYQLTTSPTPSTPTIPSVQNFEEPSFFGHSYLELPRLDAYSRFSLELEFSTLAPNGILLYSGQRTSGEGDFIALTLKNGFVEFRFDLGNGPVVLKSTEKLPLGKVHRLVAKRYLREGLLVLDGQADIAGRSYGSLKSLDLSENVFLGYIPTRRKSVFDNLDVADGMVGCIRKLKIGDRVIDLRLGMSTDIIHSHNIYACGSNPCNMTCPEDTVCQQQFDNTFKCSCQTGFTGDHCDSNREACLENSCPPGTTCEAFEDGHFICKCSTNHVGKSCENGTEEFRELFIPDFREDSYLEFPTLKNVQHSFSIELWFLSRSPEGILLYNGKRDTKGDFLAITLADRYVYFRFNLGTVDSTKSGVVNIRSAKRVTLNEWHAIKVKRFWKKGSLQVDNEPKVTAQSHMSLSELNLELNLYIGGMPNPNVANPDAELGSGLDGAVQRIIVNGETWTDWFVSAIWSHEVKQYRGPPCGGPNNGDISDTCLNGGTCVPRLNEKYCRCTTNFWGRRCQYRVREKEDLSRPVAFDGNTFLDFSLTQSSTAEEKREINILLTFKTKKSEGLLLWTHGRSAVQDHSNGFLALAIAGGKLHFIFRFGSNSAQTLLLTDTTNVNDQRWHTVIIGRNSRIGTMTVDNNDPISNFSATAVPELSADGIYWIGGYADLPGGLPEQFYYNGFEGCIKEVNIDGSSILLMFEDVNLSFCDYDKK